ncbi:fatty acid synthase subunit beta domain-containing protein, partial [Mycobacterium tuberculosis]|uniref:fatty acid synthase subunit beta domain-containing protein n=1 Tax=Mycobacterium tuberculosis TaxID=1773 RepID=UPI0015F25D7C
GGLGPPRRAAASLSGRWAPASGFPLLPLAGLLVGPAALAPPASPPSPSVPRLLVAPPGPAPWLRAGPAPGGLASRRRPLGADLPALAPRASRCGR